MTKYRLEVEGAGSYESGSLLKLILLVLKHRFWHWKHGEGWID